MDRAAPTCVVTVDHVRGVAVPAEELREMLATPDRRTALADPARSLSPIEDVLGQSL